jgi:phospholipid/cholesterol/gamma-HCH transport system substrate-binding protein
MTEKRTGTSRPTDEELSGMVPNTRAHREFRAGIFVLVGVLSVLIALFMLTDPATFRGRYMVQTLVEDAGGIRRGDPVRMRGVNIGRIHRFEMTPQGVGITLEIEGEWEIPVDSRIRLQSAGLMGGLIADVVPGTSTEMARAGMMLEGQGGTGLMEAADDLSNQASSVMSRIEVLLDEPTVQGVQSSVESLNEVLEQLSEMSRVQADRIDEITRTLNRTASTLEGTLDTVGPDAEATLADARATMEELRVTSAGLRNAVTSLETVLGRLERGEGTLGLLSTDESLYRNLNEASERLAFILEDLQANPKKYVNLSLF